MEKFELFIRDKKPDFFKKITIDMMVREE